MIYLIVWSPKGVAKKNIAGIFLVLFHVFFSTCLSCWIYHRGSAWMEIYKIIETLVNNFDYIFYNCKTGIELNSISVRVNYLFWGHCDNLHRPIKRLNFNSLNSKLLISVKIHSVTSKECNKNNIFAKWGSLVKNWLVGD